MDANFLVQHLQDASQARRAEALSHSPQLTLGELILMLKPIAEADMQKAPKDRREINLDFEYAFPTGLSSWRGSYDELAIEFDFAGYTPWGRTDTKPIDVVEFYEMLCGALGKKYEGWKGGDFGMHRGTPLWVANPGNAGEIGVIGIREQSYKVVLVTGYCEY